MADPWVKFYASDWLAGTSGLSAAERGVYITIVALIYEYDGPVPLDHTRLARRCGLPAGSFKRVLAALIAEGKLYETPEGICNDRAFSECNERENRITKAQSGAQKSNAIQAEKRQQKQQKRKRTAVRSAVREPEPEPDKREDTNVSSTKKRKTRLSETAEISEKMRAAADRRGHSQAEAEAQFSKFKNDALAKGKTFMDWDRAFVTWLDSPYFRQITGGSNVRNASGGGIALAQRVAARLDAEDRNENLDSGPDSNSVVALLPARQSFGGSGGGGR